MKSSVRTILVMVFLVSLLTVVFAACSQPAPAPTPTPSQPGDSQPAAVQPAEKRTIMVGCFNGTPPNTFVNEKGEPDGYDVSVIRAVAERLTEYNWVFESGADEVINVGIETGRYQLGVSTFWWSEERAEKYLIPEHQLGASRVGFMMKEERNDMNDWPDLVGKKLNSTASSGGIIIMLKAYNDEHPDAPITFTAVSQRDRAQDFIDLSNGVIDVVVDLVDPFDKFVERGEVTGIKAVVIDSIPTYCLINKNETELLAQIDQTLADLREEGVLSEISKKYYSGADIFAYVK